MIYIIELTTHLHFFQCLLRSLPFTKWYDLAASRALPPPWFMLVLDFVRKIYLANCGSSSLLFLDILTSITFKTLKLNLTSGSLFFHRCLLRYQWFSNLGNENSAGKNILLVSISFFFYCYHYIFNITLGIVNATEICSPICQMYQYMKIQMYLFLPSQKNPTRKKGWLTVKSLSIFKLKNEQIKLLKIDVIGDYERFRCTISYSWKKVFFWWCLVSYSKIINEKLRF